MPQLFWSLQAAPRYQPGDVLCGQYKVQKIGKEDKASQTLHANTISDGARTTIRIITRTRVKESDILDEIAWLKEASSSHSEFTECLTHYTDLRYFYIIFNRRPRTLKDVINDTNIHISRRHVIEISIQILNAVQYLNNHSIREIDITPENVEIDDFDCDEQYYDRRRGEFRYRTILRSSKIYLTHTGTTGNNPTHIKLNDHYNSPEHVYDMTITSASNVFSIGCIVAEMFLRKPLFPACTPGRLYIREKTVAFDIVLGPFPDALVHDIRRSFKGVFRYEDSDSPIYEGISTHVQDFCERAEPLKYLILEELACSVVECMTYLEPERRVQLPDIIRHPFFEVEEV